MSRGASHNPKVAGSNPAPAVQKPPLASRLRLLPGTATYIPPDERPAVPMVGGMGELFEQRVAMNEATFRKVNEAFDAGSEGPKGYLCECGQIGCNQLLSLSRAEYEAVRADGKRFFVLPGHEILEAERI